MGSIKIGLNLRYPITQEKEFMQKRILSEQNSNRNCVKFNCNNLIIKMLAILSKQGFAMFSAAKYQIYKGKYLIPNPPKRPLSSYLIFAQEARKDLQVKNISEASKLISEKWKSISDADRKKFEEQSQKIREKYELERKEFEKKYIAPFSALSSRNLITKEFHSKNQVGFGQGAKLVTDYISKMSPEEKERFEKEASKIKAENSKIAEKYLIPMPEFKSFQGFMAHLRKENPKIPKSSDFTDKELEKYKAKYAEAENEYKKNFKVFAQSFNIRENELYEMLLQKSPSLAVLEQKKAKKEIEAKLEKQEQLISKNKKNLKQEAKKIQEKYQRLALREIKKAEKETEKKNRITKKSLLKGEAELAKRKRAESEAKISSQGKKVEKPKGAIEETKSE